MVKYVKYVQKIFAFTIIFFTSASLGFSLAIPQQNNPVASVMEEDPRIRNIFIFTKGTLGNLLSSDTYHLEIKADVQYIIWAKVKISAGAFSLSTSLGSIPMASTYSWNESAKNSERIMKMWFTYTSSGDCTITITTLLATEEGSYTLYVNKKGFAGYWWMLLIGLLIIAALITPFIVLRLKSKKRRKKRRTKRRKR